MPTLVIASEANAQGFISPSSGYNFGGDSGCPSATDCEDKNWNFALSGGALGGIVGFEAELLYEGAFLGQRRDETSSVLTFMANFLLAPRISIVQPYALAGVGMIRTTVEDTLTNSDASESQIGWNVGGGLIVFVHPNIGIKGDVRYYHSFEALDLLDLEVDLGSESLDFGRAAFGVVFRF
jgi:opacity protein-like surface antigen